MKRTPLVFPHEGDLEITEELVGFHAINPFISTISSSRSYMSSSHISQIITLNDGDEKIVQTGMEHQFGENTFSKKIENDSVVISVIKRYNGVGLSYSNDTVAIVIIYEDLVTNEIDYIDIPNQFTLHQYFGFKYKWNADLINTLVKGTIIPGGSILADSPAVTTNSGYKYGVNANIAYLSLPEVSEDGVVISESFAKRMTYKIFETRIVEFGDTCFPLNIYGTEDNYKAFPDVGEVINDDSVVMVLRDFDSELTPALTSKKDVMEFNHIFDKAVCVKSPGGVIRDIKVINSPRFKKSVLCGTINGLDKYINGYKKHHSDLIEVYDELSKEHYRRHKNNNVKLSNKLQRLLVNAHVVVNKQGKSIKHVHKKHKLDLYRVEFTIEHDITIGIQSKLTTVMGVRYSG